MSNKNTEKIKSQEKIIQKNNFTNHLIPIVIILGTMLLFFNEVIFDGKVYISGDSIASKSFETVVSEARAEGIQTLWNPYIFCGMPGFASMTFSGDRIYDISEFLHSKVRTYFSLILGNSPLGGYIYYYVIFAIGVYLFAYLKLNRKSVALIVAIATLYSTYIIIWISVAHMTKIAVFAFFPFLLIVIEKLQKKINILWCGIGVIVVHFLLMPGHIQLIFYILLTVFFYYLFFIVRALILKESFKELLKSGFTLLAIGLFALGMSGDVYFSTLEYSPYSIRGAGPTLIEQNNPQNVSQATSGGLDYDYATNWSFSPGEMGTFFIPSLYGFGNTDYKGILSNNQSIRLNTYFGPQPFTDAPQYMGITILALAIFGIYYFRKNPFVQFSSFIILFSLLVSFGKEFSLIYDLMFNYFPMFNKFRIPSMILVLVQFFIPLLAGFGLIGIIESSSEKIKNAFKYISVVSGVLFLIAFILPSLFESIYESFFSQTEIKNSLSQNYGTQPEVLTELYNFILNQVVFDIKVATILICALSISIYFFILKKLSFKNLSTIIIILVLIDLWRVDNKMSELHSKYEAQSTFNTPGYVNFLLQDKSEYRVLEFVNGQPPYNNSLAYWKIQSAYGYQGAKMRNYQDIIDNIGLNNPLLWGLMNVKYIVTDKLDSSQLLLPVYKSQEKNILLNRFSLPRAFFVNRVEKLNSIDILKNLKASNFNPFEVAFTSDDIKSKIEPPSSEVNVKYTSFKMNEIELSINASGNNLLFLSETWYPKGWKAYLDETEIPIYRLNYMFRGVVVSKGNHILKMKFEPESYYYGKNISFIINLIALGSFLFFGINYYRKK